MNILAKRNDTTLYIVLAVAAVLLFSGNITGLEILTPDGDLGGDFGGEFGGEIIPNGEIIDGGDFSQPYTEGDVISGISFTPGESAILDLGLTNLRLNKELRNELLGNGDFGNACRCFCGSYDPSTGKTQYQNGCFALAQCTDANCNNRCNIWCRTQSAPGTLIPYAVSGQTCDSSC